MTEDLAGDLASLLIADLANVSSTFESFTVSVFSVANSASWKNPFDGLNAG